MSNTVPKVHKQQTMVLARCTLAATNRPINTSERVLGVTALRRFIDHTRLRSSRSTDWP